MKREEETTQTQAVQWFKTQYPKRMIAAIPNGYGHTKVWVRVIWKKLGVLAGMPDLLIPEPCGAYHGAFAEAKSKIGVLNDSQKEIGQLLRDRGYYVFTFKTLDTFISEINGYFKLPLLTLDQLSGIPDFRSSKMDRKTASEVTLNELTRIGEEMGDFKVP